MAQPVFPFTDGKSGEKYDAKTSDIVRYCVYVESDYDMDGDGKRDLVKALIQVPRSAVEGNYKAPALFEARPYCAGVQEDGYQHMKDVAEKEYRKFDMEELNHKADPRVPTGSVSAMELVTAANSTNRKNRMPMAVPNPMLANTFGMVMNISAGPACRVFGSPPEKAKTAGIIIRPAIMAMAVSKISTFCVESSIEVSFFI